MPKRITLEMTLRLKKPAKDNRTVFKKDRLEQEEQG